MIEMTKSRLIEADNMTAEQITTLKDHGIDFVVLNGHVYMYA